MYHLRALSIKRLYFLELLLQQEQEEEEEEYEGGMENYLL